VVSVTAEARQSHGVVVRLRIEVSFIRSTKMRYVDKMVRFYVGTDRCVIKIV
jgi:hypothetical protein